MTAHSTLTESPSRSRPGTAGPEALRSTIADRLRERQAELEAAIVRRVRAVALPAGAEEAPEYLAGTEATVRALVARCLDWVARGPDCEEPAPSVATEQARRAASLGIGVDVVVRRLFAGRDPLEEAIAEEAERVGLASDPAAMAELRRVVATLFERVTATIAYEYDSERGRSRPRAAQRRMELVRRLLAGEAADLGELAYPLDRCSHVCVFGSGPEAEQRLRGVSARLGLALLAVRAESDTVWSWLGANRELPMSEVEALLAVAGDSASFAVGEPRAGLDGWRETHELARAAHRVALRRPRPVTRVSDVLLDAALLAQPALCRALAGHYLEPLEGLRIGGEVARITLRSYLDCERSVSSAAQSLGLSRQALERRLLQVEEALGRRLGSCSAELDVALRVASLEPPTG